LTASEIKEDALEYARSTARDALSKNAHWMFDEGLWSITDDLKIIVAEKRFTDWSPDGFSLRNYHGRSLFFQRGCILRPDPKYLAWHREHQFRG